MLAAARWLAAQLDFAGGRVEPTAGHPVVRGEWLGAPGAPTILVYGHYDVQPTGDLAEWLTPPFELVQDGDVVRGRGSSDDKGPVYVVLKTAQAFAAQEGGLPLNVKFLFEGEEEIGSPHLPGYLAEHAAELAADLVISADGAMWRPDEPSLSLASKGLLSLDIVVTGARADLHSGRYGGTVANPLHALSQVLASLHDPDGTVAVPGFYDGIPPLTDERRREIAAVDFSDNKVPHRTRPGRDSRRARLQHAGAALGAPDAGGQRGGRRGQVHRDPARRHRPPVRPAGARPGPRRRHRGHHRARRGAGARRGPGAGPARRGPGAGVHHPGQPPGHPGRDRRAGGGLPRPAGAARQDRRHAAGHRPVRADAGRQDPVLLVLHLGREPARPQRVPADRAGCARGCAPGSSCGGCWPPGRSASEEKHDRRPLHRLLLPAGRRGLPQFRPGSRVRAGAAVRGGAHARRSGAGPASCCATAWSSACTTTRCGSRPGWRRPPATTAPAASTPPTRAWPRPG